MNQQIAQKLRKQGHEFVTGEVALDEFDCSDKTVKSVLDKPFFTWFWEVILGNSSEEYRREFYRELHRGHTIGPSPISFGSPDFKSSSLPYARVIENDLFFRLVFLMVPGSLVWLLRRVLSVAIRKLRRPSYYERERERRIMLGITRRSIRKRKTVNREPTVDEIRVAWNGARHSPEGALRLGGMLEDLECYVNNLTIGNEVEGYRGRRGGIKRHLEEKAPDLFEHYAALMRYKSIARKFRQACDIEDPNPADALLPMSAPPRPQKQRTNWSEQIKQSQDRALASAGKIADMSSGVDAEATGPAEKRSEQIQSRSSAPVGKTSGLSDDVETVTAGPTEKRSEQIKRDQDCGDGRENVVDEVGQSENCANWSEQIKREKVARDGEKGVWKEEIVVQHGVKSWVLDGFVFAWREDCWIRRESYETAIRVLRASENSVISLEAAIALEIDPNFVTREAEARFADKVAKEAKVSGGRTGPKESSDGRGGELKAGGRTVEQTGPKESSDGQGGELEAGGRTVEQTGPKESSDGQGGELEAGGRTVEQTDPKESSDLLRGDSEGGDSEGGGSEGGGSEGGGSESGDSTDRGKVKVGETSARILGWLKRRNGVA